MIREIAPGDLGWIISQHGSIYAAEFGFDSGFEVDIARKAVVLCEKNDGFTRIWIKDSGGDRVGSVAVSRYEEGIAFLNFLLVVKEYRGRGVAHELMNRAIEHAESHGYWKVRLETYSCLRMARKIYAEFGFRIVTPVDKIEKYGQKFEREFWERDLLLSNK